MASVDVTRTNTERLQYAEWLQDYRWDYFMTATFRKPRKEPYYALQHVWGQLQRHNVARSFLAVEPHESGDLHIHGILAGSITRPVTLPGGMVVPGNNLIDTAEGIWGGLFKRFGRAKVEPCNSHEAVTMYCSKYILKQQSRAFDYYGVFGNKLTWQRGRVNDVK
jgi:hypothetical protein